MVLQKILFSVRQKIFNVALSNITLLVMSLLLYIIYSEALVFVDDAYTNECDECYLSMNKVKFQLIVRNILTPVQSLVWGVKVVTASQKSPVM